MYYSQRKSALDLLDTLKEALRHAKKHPELSTQMALECVQGLVGLDEFLTARSPEYCSDSLQAVVNHLDMAFNGVEAIKGALAALQHAKLYVENLPIRYKALFLPYIASMWTALESIWKAADDDPDCDAYVVPIPYWNLKMKSDGSSEKVDCVYEGDRYPAYVPVIHYSQFSIEQEQPDMIFIHNPYDNFNNLTRIPEAYYSETLRKNTRMLVYSPYYIQGTASDDMKKPLFPVYQNMHYMLMHSRKLADLYIDSGVNPQKILVLGSPKTDHIISPIYKPVIPETWRSRAKNKTVFLFNSHFTFVMQFLPVISRGMVPYGLPIVARVIDTILSRPDCLLVWRPHPLTLQMLESRGMSDLVGSYRTLLERVRAAENGILDESRDYLAAFQFSDALINLAGSSLLYEYLLTGKPVMENIYKRDKEHYQCLQKYSSFDFLTLYCNDDFIPHEKKEWCDHLDIRKPEEFEAIVNQVWQYYISGFVDMVCNGDDPMRDKRMESVKKAFTNADGTCGHKIYNAIKEKL